MIVGITRVRNEEEIISDTIEHFSQWCEKIYVYDDCSTDRTVEILKGFNNVVVIEGKEWDKDRFRAEYTTRQRVLEEAQKENPEWILYFDADERIDWDFKGLEEGDVVWMKLFDFYITEEDKNLTYKDRKWLGQEYRRIAMLFRNSPELKYWKNDQRICSYPDNYREINAGYVKHYGKAISIEEWEKTCDYYQNFPEPYKTKWLERKGKAIHTKSDFGTELIKWEDKEKHQIQI